MSRDHGADIEATIDLPGLRVSVSGSPSRVAAFVQYAIAFQADRPRSPGLSVGSYEVVSEAPVPSNHSPQAGFGLETGDQIAASFRPCPDRLLALGNRLSGATVSGRDRAARAWTAGLWAGAVLSSRVFSPNRTPPLDLRSRFYAVARADNVDCPVIFRSSASYWRAIGSLEDSNSVSQSFPSEAEAKIYLIAAGFSEDVISVLP